MRRILSCLTVLALSLPLAARADDDTRVDNGVTLHRERDGFYCRKTETFSVQDVINERIAALQTGDIDRFVCTYAVDATVIQPGSVTVGRPAIKQNFLGLFAILGGALPVFDSTDIGGDVALVTFHIYTSFVSIPNGADTYVIDHGRIRAHTVHDVIGPPQQ